MGSHWPIDRQEQRAGLALCAAPRIADKLEGYRVSLQVRKLRPQAVETYLRDLSLYVCFLGDEATVADVTQENIEEIQATRTHPAPATSCKLLTTLRSYCRYCIHKKLRVDEPTLEIERLDCEETPPRALKTSELRRLDDVLDRALEGLLVSTGLMCLRQGG